MKFNVLIFLLLAFSIQTNAQYAPLIKKMAQTVADATIKGDFNTLVKYTYPKIVTAMGGKAKMIAVLQKGMKDMASQGTGFKSVEIGEPGKIVKAGNELHCLVPQTLSLNVTGGYITSKSTLLAISADQGKSWTFVSAGNLTKDKLKMFFPNYNKNLVIPEDTKPVFFPE